MNIETGKKFGPYEVLDVIGSSKTETVYRVRNAEENDRQETLHVLPQSKQDDLQEVELFLRETRVHSRLLHPNIVTFYRAAEVERRLVFTTEFVEGVALSERLKLGPLPWREAVAYGRQALLALGYAHAQGMIHRDVTPANIIVSDKGGVKISNFALAKFTNSPQLTQFGAVVGALEYIAPEQIKGTQTLDGRCDIYSLGIVLYEAVTGKTPFASKSQFELMLAHVIEAPKPPSAMKADLPPALDAVLLKALAKDPEQRYRSADEFLAALDAFAVSMPAADAPPQAAAVSDKAAAAVAAASPVIAVAAEMPAPEAPKAAAPKPEEPVAVQAPPPAKTDVEPPAVAAAAPAQRPLSRDLIIAALAGVAVALIVIAVYLFAMK